MSEQRNVVFWFRKDLRLHDNPGFAHAAKIGRVVPLYIYEDEPAHSPVRMGAASRWWLHHSLSALQASLKDMGLSLIIRRGQSDHELFKVIKETDANAVFWNRRYEQPLMERDKGIVTALKSQEITFQSFNANLLAEPWELLKENKQPYLVFTPYWAARQKQSMAFTETTCPKKILGSTQKISTLSIDGLRLLPKIPWDHAFYQNWQPGEVGATAALKVFISKASRYDDARNRPDQEGTSRLSPHLHFGEISPKTIWNILSKAKDSAAIKPYLRELGWREFSYYIMYHFPHSISEPLRASFKKFKWKNDQVLLCAWSKGLTGYPIVDAGMRQLWKTGWMHNRVRMIVASFLVKDLLIDWRKGAEWFWDTLVDADLANNTQGWQWTAGCGVDAAPFFRIFNPTLQSKKFDPKGDYIKKWVPELALLPTKLLHSPWEADAKRLAECKVVLGETYPFPVVDHGKAREEALKRFQALRGP